VTPDRTIVAALKRIDPGLSVAWVGTIERWGVYHDLQIDGRPDEEIDRLALMIQLDGMKCGYILSKHDCEMTAREAFTARKLVCYVTDDEGGFRSLDSRTVKKLERMDWLRRNCGLKDWRQMLDARADAIKRSRDVAQGDVWHSIRRDRVFARQVSDILWGVRPVRSIIVPEGVPDANDREWAEQADAGAAAGPEADADCEHGVGVAAPDDHAGTT
jgi:hypothetical protein